MTTFSLRSLAMGALAVLALAGAAIAQTTSPILNTIEVRKLVASAQPADQARLVAHFTALAERYNAEAREHEAMATSYAGNPRGNLGAGMSLHCKRIAVLNTDSAKTLRELASYHSSLAGGATAPFPKDGARFQAGAGAKEPTEAELKALAAKAATRADHLALEEYFRTAAKRYTADADTHTALAQSYRGTKIAQAAVQCDRLVKDAREAAKEAIAAADMHHGLAGAAR